MATQVDTGGLPYSSMGGIDPRVASAIGDFIASSKKGKIQLGDLSKELKTTYKPFEFKSPEYNGKIESVADLSPAIKEAIFEQSRSRIGRAADSQRGKAIDALNMRPGSNRAIVAALRDINKDEFQQTGDLTVQNMIADATRAFDEAKTMRSMNLENERYKTGLADTLATRQAAEAEKKYGYDYGREQDIINTKMNKGQFDSAENANEASRVQAAIQQGLNYMNQGGNYRLNVEQLRQKGGKDKQGLDFATVSGGVANGVGQIPYTPGSVTPLTARQKPQYTNPNQNNAQTNNAGGTY